MDEALVKRFAGAFQGYELAYGQYTITGQKESGKVDGRGVTVHGSPTLGVWRRHLEGQDPGMGSIPHRQDDTCLWGAMDVDVYDIDPVAFEKQCREKGLPLVVCATKSSGVHGYAFFAEPTPASVVRSWLENAASSLGYGGCEVFPKQVSRTGPRDTGNWINLPYFGGSRRAILDGEFVGLARFLDLVDERRFKPASGKKRTADESGDFGDGPPCLQHLAKTAGFPEGTRNDGLYNVAVYLRKKNPDGWKDDLQRWNVKMCDPPLTLDEVDTIAKSVSRKSYEYTCNRAPIKPHCNRRLCLRRKCGVGDGPEGNGVEITGVTKYPATPTLWCIEIDSTRFEVDTNTLFSHSMFAKACMDKINRCPSPVNQARWQEYLDEKLRTADVVPPPEDADEMGQFRLFLDQWLSGRTQARDREEIVLDKPWHEGGKVYFLSSSLRRRLDQEKFPYKSMHHVWHLLRELGADKEQWNLKGNKTRQVWFLPEFGEDPTEHEEGHKEKVEPF